MCSQANDRQIFWYRAFDELTGYHHFQAESSEMAFRWITSELGYTNGVQIHDLSREMEWRCICTEESHEFINMKFPQLPGIWKCTVCETVFLHPPDEIDWEFIEFHQAFFSDDDPPGAPYYEDDYELEMHLAGLVEPDEEEE